MSLNWMAAAVASASGDDGTLAAREAVSSNLEALFAFIAPLEMLIDSSSRVTRLLQTSIIHWRAEAIGAVLASESCEVVVAVLRLLRGDLGLPPSRAVHAYTCAFLVLASTVRVFEEARDMPGPGQRVTLGALQSAAAQRLNGAQGIIMRFHPESGRFLVRLEPDDPPAEWKKVRAENLVIAHDESPKAKAVNVAREHGVACLEAVAPIFDDLLQDMLLEASELDDDCLQKLLAAELAAAMWEVLVCCAGDGALRLSGASFAELCGSTALCALFARYVLSAQIGMLFIVPTDLDGRGPQRLRSLQESLLRSYCELYQPAAFWRDGDQVGDAPIATLQADLEAHRRSVAEAAVNFDVLPALIEAIDFHLSWVSSVERPGPLPLVMPVLLSRLICSLIAPATAAIGATRHVQMHMSAIADVVYLFTMLASDFLVSQGPVATASSQELLAGLRAVLDSLVAVSGIGLWSLGDELAETIEATTSAILDTASAAADPGMLARLALVYMRKPPAAGAAARLAVAYSVLPQAWQASFWGQLRARATVCNLSSADAHRMCQDWLAASGIAFENADLNQVAEDAGANEVAHQHLEIDQLIDKCLRELPQNLRAAPAATTRLAQTPGQSEAPWPPAADANTAPLAGVCDQGPPRLSMLDMPALPNKLGAQATAAPKSGQRRKLARADFGKIRGVDPAMVPQELRCAIDGKILGTPLRSPYGHVFEKDTLENWVRMCGSVCPITGQPLRLDDCQEDRAAAQQVLEWAKASKAEHRRSVQERRQQRAENGRTDLDTGVLL